MRLNDKTAIVTGAGRGIGKAVAVLFGKEGANVVVCDVDEDVSAETAKEITDAGGTALSIPCDVSSSSAVSTMIDAAYENFGSIDIIANIAGLTRDRMIHKMSEERWDTVIDINLKGTFLVCQAAAKYMRKSGRGGSIVNISSASAQRGNPGQTNYAAAKAGVMGFSRSLANEWGRFGIRVNVVSYGLVDTRMTKPKEDGVVVDGEAIGIPQAMREAYIKRIPLGFVGSPEDAAYPVLFLASEEARYITGQVLSVNGGTYM